MFYADNLKIFKVIRGVEDAFVLQQNIVNVNEWCYENDMLLNVSKCKFVSFCRRRAGPTIQFNYDIQETMLEKCSYINDLGIMLDEKLNMLSHFDFILNKARRIWGFVKRQSKEFMNPYVTKSLYCSLVRPHLEYCSVVWMPHSRCHVEKLESIQKQFLLFALRGLGWSHRYILPPYHHRLQLLSMNSLEDRRLISSATFMYKLVNDIIDVPSLKENIRVNESRYMTRNRNVVLINNHSTNYGQNAPMTRLLRLFNEHFDIYEESLSVNSFKSSFKKKILHT